MAENDKDAITLLRLKRGRGLVTNGARGVHYLARARYAACVRTYTRTISLSYGGISLSFRAKSFVHAEG